MAVYAFGAQLENHFGMSRFGPVSRMTMACFRVWDAFRMARRSSFASNALSPSSISSVGFKASTARNTPAR